MKLSKIRIRNFRSILDEEFSFDSSCVGFIGLNESGKSNILKAVLMADGNYTYSPKDRSKLSGLLPSVQFEFTSTPKKEIGLLLDSFLKEKVVSNDEIHSTIEGLNSIVYSIEFEEEEDKVKENSGYSYEFGVKLNKALLQRDVSVAGAESLNIRIGEKDIPVASIEYIDGKLIKEEQSKFFKELDIDGLKESLNERIDELLSESFPKIIFWEYSDKYLLPSEITYDSLMKGGDPRNNSAPLYNILRLKNSLNIRDVDDLTKKITLWKADSSVRRKDGRIITDILNEYIKGIWLDYNQQLYIEFEESKITIHINDPQNKQSNFYEMEARSQGFKTFISFILTIATEAHEQSIENFLLLLDEPETHLHPSGVRYMRDELFKLANMGNYIIYATHSIFMIDRRNLTRHLIVSKNEEVTTLRRVDRNNFIQEAVIYEAMGTQLDEFSIGMSNVIFEGEIDRKLWDFYINKCLDKKARGTSTDYVLWDGGGTKNITKFFSDKMLPKNSQWFLALDNDTPAHNLRKFLEEKYGKSDINCICIPYSTSKDVELEDILPKEMIEQAIQDVTAQLGLKPKVSFTYTNTRTIASLVNDFKDKNGITKEQSFLFEKTYKDSIDSQVSSLLNTIESEAKSIADRNELFVSHFEKYTEFCRDFIKQFNSES